MAGTFGAIICKTSSFSALFSLHKDKPNLHVCSIRNPHFLNHSNSFYSSSKRVLAMAEVDPNTDSFQIQEPLSKIAKPCHHSDASASLLRVKKLSENAVLPSRGSSLSAGYDLSSAVEIKVPARGKALVPTDISIGIPEGTYARIAPRSGLAHKHSICVGAGVIDADYRGPVGVILFNHSDADFEVKTGDRIAQLILEKIITPEVMEVEDLDVTARGPGGFGSTGY